MVKANTVATNGIVVNADKVRITDVVFLAGIVIAIQGYFVRDLGFYSDDWWVLNTLASAKSNSFIDLAHSAFGSKGFIVRPVQGLELTILYWLFGTKPLGYHVVNALTAVLGIVLFHLALTRLKLHRIIAVGVPLIYALLPHYSTTRFWISCFCANVSIVLFFLNLYTGLRYISAQEGTAQRKGWLLISSLSVVACVMAYEVVLPLFLINFFIFWLQSKKQHENKGNTGWHKYTINALLICNVLLLVGGIAYKFLLSERTGGFNVPYIVHVWRVLRGTVTNDYWTYGVKLPVVIWKIVKSYYNSSLFLIGALVSLAVFIYLFSIKAIPFKRADWLKLIAVGIVAYFGGYAAFLVTTNFQVSAAGISNRIAVAASVGIAICFVGGAGLLCSFIKAEKAKNVAFSLALAGVAFCGYVINCTISRFYLGSYAQQLTVLDSIYTNATGLSKDKTVILDGICPYVGPVPVFDCNWDLSEALALHYKFPILADVRTRRLSYNKNGILTYVYSMEQFYPYSENLMVYNYKRKKTYRISDFREATIYFSLVSPKLDECADALEGEGIRIFK